MVKRAPDLTGAWVQRVEASGGTLMLAIDGLRRFGCVLGGVIIFEGVTEIEGSDPRPASRPPALSGGYYVSQQQSEPDKTVLVMKMQTGPGDVDTPRFAITHASVSADLRLRPAKTLRSWLGFYPLAKDRQF